jgi:hypothetical protein
MLSLLPKQSSAQSKVSSQSGNTKDDYAYAYSASEEEVLALAADRIYERGYAYKKASLTNANPKSYGIIIESSYATPDGNIITLHATASGCRSLDDAKKLAYENLKKSNPNSKYTSDYKVVAKFETK